MICHHDETGKGRESKTGSNHHTRTKCPSGPPPPPFRDLSAPSSAMTGRRGALEWNDPRPCASPVTGQRQGGLRIVKEKKPGHASRTGLRMTSASAPYC